MSHPGSSLSLESSLVLGRRTNTVLNFVNIFWLTYLPTIHCKNSTSCWNQYGRQHRYQEQKLNKNEFYQYKEPVNKWEGNKESRAFEKETFWWTKEH